MAWKGSADPASSDPEEVDALKDRIIAEGPNGERYGLDGPYRLRSRIARNVGGVYVILTSPHPGLYNYVYVGESENIRDEISSPSMRRRWKKEGNGKMHYAYLCTDGDTKDMDAMDAKVYRTHIKDILRSKYDSSVGSVTAQDRSGSAA